MTMREFKVVALVMLCIILVIMAVTGYAIYECSQHLPWYFCVLLG